MTREDAIDRASALAGKLDLEQLGARRAALFTHDGATQNFVELAAGGKPRFAELLSGEIYAPYWWEVRLFKPNETAEARVRFKPDGSPYGFQLKVPEALPGAALDASAARAIAETGARRDWAIDFAPYKLLEQSDVRRSSGRVDHAFVYERERETLGDGRFRLRLGVSGDRLSEVSHYVYVPEAFKLRFQEMRSDNETIAKVASLAAAASYGIGGCIIGTLLLLRRRALLWKNSLIAGAIVAGLNALALIANAPQAWFSYDTAQPVWVFWMAQLGIAMLVFVVGSLGLALVFMAAEGLSRRAFPDHPQLWRIWSRAAAPTPAILGRTVGGYLFVPIELALIAAFYFVTNRYLGWWQPSEALTDPNILGSALPALAPIGMALQAGFMEECLFRAVPLSIAALLGQRFGHRGLLIGLALVLQAVIFGAAHARLSAFAAGGLVIPAFIWGLIFPAPRVAHDGDPSCRFRPRADVDSGFSRRRLRQRTQSGARRGGGTGAVGDRLFAPGAGRKVAGASVDVAQQRVAAWRGGRRDSRGTRPGRGRALDHSHATCAARPWSGGIADDSVRCRLSQRCAAALNQSRQG